MQTGAILYTSLNRDSEGQEAPLGSCLGELLLKDFFQATIGIPYAIIIISPTECMLFAPGCSKDLGMSYENSKAHCQSLNSIHPWVGSAMEVTTLQRMVKDGRYDMARAKQYTHERTKERLAKMHA